MLTLSPKEFAMPLSKARRFNPEVLKTWARKFLVGLDYFGMVDIALYTNFAKQGNEPTVSWHIHVIVWNRSKLFFERLVARINRTHSALIEGRTAAHLRVVKDVLGRLCYVLKGPLSEYRVYPSKEESIDPDTGEVTRNWIQRKRPLQPGKALKVCHVLAGRSLPSLAFAGGDGTDILTQTILMARGDLRLKEQWRERKLAAAFKDSRKPVIVRKITRSSETRAPEC